jgi:hypothetical protein
MDFDRSCDKIPYSTSKFLKLLFYDQKKEKFFKIPMIGRLLFTLYWLLLRWSWTVRRSGKLLEVTTSKSTANKYRIKVTNLKWEHIPDILILWPADSYYMLQTKKHNPLLSCQVESRTMQLKENYTGYVWTSSFRVSYFVRLSLKEDGYKDLYFPLV